MRLCFYNPHDTNNATGTTLLTTLAQTFGTNKNNLRKHNLKYGFLLDILKHSKYNTAIVIDGAGTSLGPIFREVPFLHDKYVINRTVSFFEIYIWCLLNGLNPLKQTIIFDRKRLNPKSDILFGFAYCSESFLSKDLIKKGIMATFKGKKLLHASHFYKQTSKIAQNVKMTGVKYMVAEANLKKSPYFNKFFPFIKQVYVFPHVLRKRYKKTREFSTRLNKCLALGTLVIEDTTSLSNKDHYNFFKVNTLHPMRKLIYENKENLSDYIDSYINFHNAKRIAIANKSGFYNRNGVFRMIYDLFFLSEGKDYHQMDIVEKYNGYRMFMAPEENIGLTSVNVVEGMACCCAYIGMNHQMYKDLGLIAGRHYIGYDGSLPDLKRKIKYYQDHPRELEIIAQNGYNFSRENFPETKVLRNLWKFLEHLTKS